MAIRNTPTPHPCHMGNGFPRRCAPRNDIFTKIILSCVGAGVYPARLRRIPNHASVGGGDCPPSCQPIPIHCRGRQSGHFLETGSLLPPPAALRRFPRRPVSPHPLICPCRAAPMCAAADTYCPPAAGHTGPALQAFYQLRTPCPAPVGRGDLTPLPICTAFPKNLSLRTGAHAGVAIRPSFFRPFIQKIKPKIMQNIKIQKPLANKGTQC